MPRLARVPSTMMIESVVLGTILDLTDSSDLFNPKFWHVVHSTRRWEEHACMIKISRHEAPRTLISKHYQRSRCVRRHAPSLNATRSSMQTSGWSLLTPAGFISLGQMQPSRVAFFRFKRSTAVGARVCLQLILLLCIP